MVLSHFLEEEPSVEGEEELEDASDFVSVFFSALISAALCSGGGLLGKKIVHT